MNVFACLVHEAPECALDLVRNLHYIDPQSRIVVYNGGPHADLLTGFESSLASLGVMSYPNPRRLKWGRLHDFALDCMRWSIRQGPFDTLTIVDSDQLGLRKGYSAVLLEHVASRPRLGMLGILPRPRADNRPRLTPPALSARAELELWLPFLRQFPEGTEKFAKYVFWPSTVFTAAACHALISLWDESELLHSIMAKSKMWATEEVLLPTLVALLGFEIESNPFSAGFVTGSIAYRSADLERALATPNAHWMHPVPRLLGHPVRHRIRSHFDGYGHGVAQPVVTRA